MEEENPKGLITYTEEKDKPIDGFNQISLIDTLTPIIYFTNKGCMIYLASKNKWANITHDFMRLLIQKYIEY